MSENNLNTLSAHIEMKKVWQLLGIVLITAVVWNLPISVFDIDGLTVVQQRIIAIFVFATLSWLTECIPAWATSLAIMTIMCVTVSENSFQFFKGDGIGELLKSKEIMASFADPIIMLFLAGFILAIAASKSGLDTLLAKNMIRPFGNKSENVLLGFLFITGIFSMFISNTATAALMLTFLAPVFASLPANGKGRIALTMSIPLAANLGGIGTPIGTPPNMIAMKFLNDPDGLNLGISFGQWMLIMGPLVVILLLICWRVILYFFPFSKKTIELEIKGEIHRGWRMYVVIATFIITILLWIIPKEITGINTNTVSMIPMGIFAITGVINAKDLQQIDWSVIWMVAGGFALGLGMNGSGLADVAIESIPFGSWSPIVILIVSGLICYFLSNFISNTATAALLMPILTVVCRAMGDKLDVIGGTSTVLLGVAIAASTAMCLPISTPPNAIAYSTGLVEQKDMLKTGITCGIISIVLGYGLLFIVGELHLLG
ncbi:dihydroorotate dehydrogenase [Prevotella intermedia]|jgi:transporter, DASS family|uniref:Dihydroorotate dehydrogenase n=2 Tax=Prevotella intermedia TaxID=28131 RepID=A0AAJ3VET2_PREIN|nr:SLC13 family permease [Prevotella intermedia]AFJ09548.1 transporter, DASS family [Prevotella intermedia 17]APW34136.1 dihydroorotate dehydrogenase [Prevotella intermedia]ATV54260.1 dihydroorotate dehydrogenase [Prevotella intermedia]PJI20739.1 dihydroorotate dehydrogenase [Prevotella intermedia]